MPPTDRPDDGPAAPETASGPVVTIVIPTFRRAEQLIGAVNSALDASAPEREIIVIDDSPERSAEAAMRSIDDPRVRYEVMPTPSGGRPALVRNLGLELAQGTYLYFLDDDDRVVPGALGNLVEALKASRAGVAFGRVESFGPDPIVRDEYQRWWDWAADTARRVRWSSWLTTGVIMFRGTLIINSTCMIRRDAAVALGGYDASLAVYEDVDFFTRGIRRFGPVFVDTPVLRYSTGLTSIIHDLHGDSTPVAESNAQGHAKYRTEHGILDYRALQVVSKLLPLRQQAR